MTKNEFENVITPKVNNDIGGTVSPMMWNDIELVYINTGLTKTQVADLFWNHTGGFSTMARMVKEMIACKAAYEKSKMELSVIEDLISGSLKAEEVNQ